MKNFLKIFKKSVKDKETEHHDSLKDILKNKYLTFQSLLRENNRVLELMADMEEKLSDGYLFDRHYINTQVGLITKGVFNIIENINALSKDKYVQLHNRFDYISKEIQKTLERKIDIPITGYTIPLEGLTRGMSNIAGGKMSHLGEIKNRLKLQTPDGFSITAFAFKRFIEHNKLSERINEYLSQASVDNMEALTKTSEQIQKMVIGAEIPEDLRHAVDKEVEGLKLEVEKVSVRSSAILEDGEFSFAGQYATFLNVPCDSILQKYKEVIASLFTPRAIFYYKTKGFSEEEMVMAVGVLRMVDAKAGGVMYTKDPNDPERNVIIINAVWGLGKSVVDGRESPNSYIVSRETKEILEKMIPEQHTMIRCALEGDIREVSVSDEFKDKPCLTDEQIYALSDYASALENHYGSPQDIEWVIDQDDQTYILQSRQLKTFNVQGSISIPRRIEKYNILIDKGVIACKGIGYGKAFVLRDNDNLENFPEGAVLVARNISTDFVIIMDKASAIITDTGSIAGHMASLAREYQVPTILDARVATTLIKDGQEITVDAINCNVYEGRVDEILRFTVQRSTFRDIPIFRTLKMVFNRIAPLNLVSPEDKNFKPEYCKTFHDITRFAHEKAMDEMFNIGEGHEIEEILTIKLRAGIPVDTHIIDVDGGVKDNIKKATYEDILSIPFSAVLKGMRSMKWPEPRPADVKGFFGMIAHTASIPEEEIQETAEKSFAVISRNYVNFSIRLGYHFSMIEAYAGENLNNNYIKFFFKGGGAVQDRRRRRIRLIKEILKKMDFRVNVTGDVMDAAITKYKQSAIEEKLVTLGKLTAYTKQLDMVMYNDAVTDWYIEEFVKEHL